MLIKLQTNCRNRRAPKVWLLSSSSLVPSIGSTPSGAATCPPKRRLLPRRHVVRHEHVRAFLGQHIMACRVAMVDHVVVEDDTLWRAWRATLLLLLEVVLVRREGLLLLLLMGHEAALQRRL